MVTLVFIDLDGTIWDGKDVLPNVYDLLDYYRYKKYPMFVVSRHAKAKDVIHRLGLAHYFKHIYDRTDCSLAGGKKNIIEKQASNYNCSHIIFIDDQQAEYFACLGISPMMTFYKSALTALASSYMNDPVYLLDI